MAGLHKRKGEVNMSLEELQNIMTEYGIVIRAIPRKVKYIQGNEIKYDRIPEHAGEIMVEQVRSCCRTVQFTKRYFKTIEEAVNAVVNGKLHEVIYTERKGVGTCGLQ